MLRLGVTFSGRVQGVGFRATARSIASGYAVSGWVRNEPDGTVAMQVQGKESEVHAFLEALSARLARNITGVDRHDLPTVPDEVGFEIRR